MTAIKKTRFPFLFSLTIIATCLGACKHDNQATTAKKDDKTKMLRAEVFIVKPQSFAADYTASGSLLPNEEIQILPEVSGRVTNISFKEGTHVEKGQMLLQIYNDDIKAQIQKLQAQKELQIKIENRQAELLRIGGISQQDYETTVTQIQSIDADIAYSRAMLRKTTIYAPFPGKIGIRNVSVGAVITPSTVIATLQQTKELKMDFSIPDQYKKNVEIATQVYFTVVGNLDTFAGKVIAVEPTANVTTRTLKVRALVENQTHTLTAGAFTHVIIPFESNNSALLIPPQSVIPTTTDKKVAVIKNGKANMVTVIIGERTNDKVEIIQGLKAGDTIITTGIMQVKQGMAVAVSKTLNP
jgi:membrane fusion protein (multidrug efflux system)